MKLKRILLAAAILAILFPVDAARGNLPWAGEQTKHAETPTSPNTAAKSFGEPAYLYLLPPAYLESQAEYVL